MAKNLKIIYGFWIFVVFSLFIIIQFTPLVSATWWNSSWERKAPINISVSSGSTPQNYQVLINITYDSKMQPDFDGLRFLNATETGELNFWLEDKVDSSWALVWVEIDQVINVTNRTLAYMYYNNSAASSASNGQTTFDFFDGFPGDTLNTTKWDDVTCTGCVVSNGILNITKGSVGMSSGLGFNFNDGYICEGRIGTGDADTGGYGGGLTTSSTTDFESGNAGADAGAISHILTGSTDEADWELAEADGSAASYNLGVTYPFKVTSVGSPWYIVGSAYNSSKLSTWMSNSTQARTNMENNTGVTWSKNISFVRIGLFDDYDYDVRDTWYDWVLVRKWHDQDPFPPYSIGAEETSVETIKPTYSNNQTNNTNAGQSTLFSILYDDDTALHSSGQYIFSTNNTGTWTNESAVNFTATPSWANVTKTLNSTGGLSIGYRWFADDNAGNINNTPIYTLTTVDITPPTFITIPGNTTINYTQGFGVDFDATDETEFDSYAINWTTLFQINQSGYLENSTANIAVGEYLINVTINDTSNNLNSTIYKVTVNQAVPEGSLTSTNGWTIDYAQGTTIGISENNTGDGDLTYKVYRDDVDVGTGAINLSVGEYDYVLNTTGGTNWTANASMDSETLTIEKIGSQTSLTFDVASPQTYGTAITPTCSVVIGEGSAVFEMDGDIITSGNPITLGADTYSFNCSLDATQNYTASSNLSDYTIDKAIPIGSLTSDLGWTINESQEVEIGLSESNTGDGDVTYIVYRDEVAKGTGETWSPPFGTYDYVLNTTGGANYSANSSMDTETLTVNDIINPLITIIYPTNITYSTNVSELNYTYTEINPDSCWYSRDGGATNSSAVSMGTNFTGVTSVGGSNTWIVYCNDTSNNINSSSITFTLNKLWYNTGFPFTNESFRINEFINVSGTNFTLGGENYRFIGADSYYLADYATNFTYDDDGNEINNSRQYVLEILNEAHYLNINVIRTWAGMQGSDDSHWVINESGGHYNLFEVGEPGNYSEEMFAALDWVIYEASKRDVRLQLVFINNWNDYGGMRWYAQKSPTTNKTYQWVNDTGDDNYWLFHDQFYDDENCRQYYRNYINHTLNRNNTYSGILYKDDPAIFAWLLANEPRAKSDGTGRGLIQDWTTNMTAYIKSIDSNHLVGLGIEGWGYVETWGEGTDMIADHNNTGVDFATYALHPDQWQYFAERSEHDGGGWVTEGTGTNTFVDWWTIDSGLSYNNRYADGNVPDYIPALARYGYDNWVTQNVKWADDLGLPILLQEAGYLTSHDKIIKDRFYEQMIHNFYNEGGDGLLFWTLNHDNYYYSTDINGSMDDGYGFYLSDDPFLSNKSESILDAINFTKYDNDGESWIRELNDYKYDFVFNIGFASDTLINNCTLNLNISNGTGWTNYYVDQVNSTPINRNEDYTFEKQFNTTAEEFYWYIRCLGDSTYIDSNSTYVQIRTGVPLVNLVSPNNDTSHSTSSLDLVYNVSGDLEISYCELYVDSNLNKTSYIVLRDINQSFLVSGLSDAAHNWSIKCTDIDSNEGFSETRNFVIDATLPQISLVYPTNTTYTSIQTELNYTASDISLQSCWYSLDGGETNETITCGNNVTGLNSGQGSSTWTVYANDTFGNENQSSVTFFVDSINPSVTSLTETPLDPATYSLGGTYEFNATITDTNLQIVLIEFNGTNYTPSNIAGDVYNFSILDLSVGEYNYRWFANDTLGNVNNTENDSYTINQNPSDCDVLFNTTSPKTYPYSFLVWSNCDSTFTLYRNGTIIANNSVQALSVGTWNFTVIRTDQTNYSNIYNEEEFVIDKATPVGSLIGTSPITYGTEGDVEGTEDNVGDGGCSYKLYREGIEVSNPDETILSTGSYDYVYNTTGCTNYSASVSLDTFELTVDIATGEGTLLLNGSADNMTINRTETVNITAILDTGSGDIYVYINTTLFDSGSSPISGEEQFNTIGYYLINFTYPGNENYTGFEKHLYVNVVANPLAIVNITYPPSEDYEENIVALNYTVLYGVNCWYNLGVDDVSITCGDNVTGITSSDGDNIWTIKAENLDGVNTTDSVHFVVRLPIEYSDLTLNMVRILQFFIVASGFFIIFLTVRSFYYGDRSLGRVFRTSVVVGIGILGLVLLMPIMVNYIADLIH